jgi:hypothetical protein
LLIFSADSVWTKVSWQKEFKEFGSGTQSYSDRIRNAFRRKEKMKQRKRKRSVYHMKVESKVDPRVASQPA